MAYVQKPADTTVNLEVAAIDDPSGAKYKVIKQSEGSWHQNIIVKEFDTYTRRWTNGVKLMSPTETDLWLKTVSDSLKEKIWERPEVKRVGFYAFSPRIIVDPNQYMNEVYEPEITLTNLHNAVQELRDNLGS